MSRKQIEDFLWGKLLNDHCQTGERIIAVWENDKKKVVFEAQNKSDYGRSKRKGGTVKLG